MAWSTWFVYLVAVIGLSLTPGPNSLLAITHGALHGHARTLWTIAGGSVGFVLLIGLTMLGIGSLLLQFPQALTGLKWVGGAYLVWLGIQIWRAPALQLSAPDDAPRPSSGRLFRQGFLAAASNPKALLFYGAFLPQFIDPARDWRVQFLVIALTFAIVECVVEYGLARAAHRVRPWLERVGRRFNKACGALFTLMGAALPLSR